MVRKRTSDAFLAFLIFSLTCIITGDDCTVSVSAWHRIMRSSMMYCYSLMHAMRESEERTASALSAGIVPMYAILPGS